MWMEYVGPRYPGGIVEDYEHTKFYWGPENDYKCDIPDRLAGMILQEKGTEMFMPCLAPVEAKTVELPKEEPEPEKPKLEPKPEKPKRRRKGR